jgi:hypothetical protein
MGALSRKDEAMDLETNPEEIKSEVEHEGSLRGRSGNFWNTEGVL